MTDLLLMIGMGAALLVVCIAIGVALWAAAGRASRQAERDKERRETADTYRRMNDATASDPDPGRAHERLRKRLADRLAERPVRGDRR